MTKDIEKILARKCETLDDGRIVIVPDMSDCSDLVDELNALFLLHGVVKSLPTNSEMTIGLTEVGDAHRIVENLAIYDVVGQSEQLVCDVCGSTDVIEAPHMGKNCNQCHPL